MNRKILIAAALLLMISIPSIGYAVTYNAMTVSTDNTVDYSGDLVEILSNDGSDTPIGSAIQIRGPTQSIVDNVVTVSGSSTIDGYKLKVNSDSQDLVVRCWIEFADPRSWAIVDSITLSVSSNEEGSSSFDIQRQLLVASEDTSESQPTYVAIPSATFNLSANNHNIHEFKLTITFKSVSLYLNGQESDSFVSLQGSKLIFVASDSDPLSSS